ncbi:MAG: hypothetical protein ACYC2H_05325 [Thermoplasmatota archaeon]
MTKPPFRLRPLVIAGTLALVAGMILFTVTATKPPTDDDHTICHATGSASNPYVVNSPDKEGVHDGHLGESHQNGDDIVPPFTYHNETHSQNWDAAGQAIFDNDCNVPTSSTSTSTSETTTTTSETTTTRDTTTSTSETTTTTTQIPVFGSGTAVALGVGGSVIGTLLMLRRRL